MSTATRDTTAPPRSRAEAPRRRQPLRLRLAPYVFISPFYLLFLIFLLVPILVGLYLSFTEWAGLGTPEMVGLANYRRLFGDDQFYLSLRNTLFFVLVAMVVVVPLALMVAQALNTRGLRGRDLFRVVYFTPIVLSPIVIVLVFQLFFDKNFGLLNAVLQAVLGSGGIDWLGDPWWARVSVAILIVWRWTGYLVIFFLAGLQGVPRELHEAAEIDGAGPVKRFLYVTLPALKPVTAFIVVTSLVGTAQIFDEPYLLTGGGPNFATLTVGIFIYRAAFQRQELGYAAAAGVVLFVVVFVIGQVANRLLGVGRNAE
ncbi:sugar ABC transporter permease [Kribbella hippodromi]|uniref:Sugar ABC transporter permease n=1 Tax=Kribbella hippodromi TaxID=434347 RepID=A0ABN2D6X8_9ACTN